jgi:hypothetical protein
MHARAIEFRFPDGSFEIAMNTRLPLHDETIRLEGRLWSVVETVESLRTIVKLEAAEDHGHKPGARASG